MCRIVLKLVHMHLVANTRMKTTLLYSCIACTCTYVSMVHSKVCIFSLISFLRAHKKGQEIEGIGKIQYKFANSCFRLKLLLHASASFLLAYSPDASSFLSSLSSFRLVKYGSVQDTINAANASLQNSNPVVWSFER